MLGLKNRIINMFHPSLVDWNLRKLSQLLADNEYPSQLVNKLLFSTLRHVGALQGRNLSRQHNILTNIQNSW